MTPVTINVLEALRLLDIRNGAGDEVQSGMLEHFTAAGLVALEPGGYVLTELGNASLDGCKPGRGKGEGV
jgi:hypothetical protein